jgi:hypothetical protein
MESASTVPPTTAAPDRPLAEKSLLGRFMLPDTTEHKCQVLDLTLDGAVFTTQSPPPPGLSIVAYIDSIGRVVGVSEEPVEGGFKVHFTLEGAQRDRLASRLQSLGKTPEKDEAEPRRATRFRPVNTTSQLGLADGRVYACEVLDISLTGAAIKTEVMPRLGAFVLLGRTRGRVVRYIEHGIAIEFISPLDRATLADQVR